MKQEEKITLVFQWQMNPIYPTLRNELMVMVPRNQQSFIFLFSSRPYAQF